MEFKVRLSRATIKALEAELRQGYRAADVRVIRRVQALLEVGAAGRPVGQVAARLGLHESTVYGWLHAFLVDGLATLRYGRAPGRPSKLTPSQKQRLCALIEAGPLAAGYPSGCWSTLFLQDLIQREFGQFYNHHYVATLLRNLGFSYQKARFVSDHLDPERRRHWREQTWPTILAEAERRGALLLFGDPKWTDYDLSLEVMTTGGGSEVSAVVRAAGLNDFTVVLLGGWKNTYHGILPVSGGHFLAATVAVGKTAPSRWYRLKIEVRRSFCRLQLDGKFVATCRIVPSPKGRVGVRTVGATARFRNFKVTDPAGKVLFEGLPPLPGARDR